MYIYTYSKNTDDIHVIRDYNKHEKKIPEYILIAGVFLKKETE